MAIRVVSIISRMNVGGPALLLSQLFNELPSPEYEHVLITGRCETNEIDFLEAHQVTADVIYIDGIRRSIFLGSDIQSFFKLVSLLKNLNPDIVHTHTSKAGLLGRLAAYVARPNVPRIHTYHGHLLYGYFGKIKTSFFVNLERFLGRLTDRYVAVTYQVMEDLLKVGIGPREKWSVINPGVEKAQVIDSIEVRYDLNIDEMDFVLVWIGRFTEIKNPLLALNALSSVMADNPQKIRMFMLGDGELLDECKQLANNLNLPVTFVGWVTDVSLFLSAANLLIMSSRNEGMPLVIIEAAQHGVPTISTDVGGVSEFITPGITGFLVPESASSMAKELNHVISEREILADVSRAAKTLALDKFSVRAYGEKHKSLYKSLIASNQ
jgi:glycosyltransferase involved in cell wall biosynthesis